MLQAFILFLADMLGLGHRRQVIAVDRLPPNFLR